MVNTTVNTTVKTDYEKAMEEKTQDTLPIWKKFLLTPKEASMYTNIGINKINSMLRSSDCSFVFFVGRRKLVRRI